MEIQSSTPSPEQLQVLSQVVRDVARSRRLSPADSEDFAQTVHLTLLERRYDVFTQFGGRSSLRTFLTTVVRRLLIDWRNQTMGRWRPSAAARRAGPHASMLERLVYRDGLPSHEAVSLVCGRRGAPPPDALLDALERLPVRPRRRMVSEECLRDVTDPRSTHDSTVANPQADLGARRAAVRALRHLAPEDRWLVCMRYGHGQSVQSLAGDLGVEAKPLYRRFDRLLQSVRTLAREVNGVHPNVAAAANKKRQPGRLAPPPGAC